MALTREQSSWMASAASCCFCFVCRQDFETGWSELCQHRYTAMLIPHQISRKDGLVYNPEGLELFLNGKLFVSYNWLRDFAKVPKPAVRVKEMMLMMGFQTADELFNLIWRDQRDRSSLQGLLSNLTATGAQAWSVCDVLNSTRWPSMGWYLAHTCTYNPWASYLSARTNELMMLALTMRKLYLKNAIHICLWFAAKYSDDVLLLCVHVCTQLLKLVNRSLLLYQRAPCLCVLMTHV